MTEEDSKLLVRHDQRIKSLEERMKAQEEQTKALNTLAFSVKELTINQTRMLEEQKEQGERIQKLEQEPLERVKHIREKVIDCIVTGIVAALLGVLIGFFIGG